MKTTMIAMTDLEADQVDGGTVAAAWKLFNCVSALIVDAIAGTQSSEGVC